MKEIIILVFIAYALDILCVAVLTRERERTYCSSYINMTIASFT